MPTEPAGGRVRQRGGQRSREHVINGDSLDRTLSAWRAAWMAIALLACAKPDATPATGRDQAAAAAPTLGDTAHVTVTRPTVIAFFIVPPGAVDTLPDLAVEADDWNYAMATLRDSLEANRIDLAMVTQPVVRIDSAGARAIAMSLGAPLTAGYVFVRRGDAPCLRRGGVDQAELLATARRFVTRAPSPDDTSSGHCDAKVR